MRLRSKIPGRKSRNLSDLGGRQEVFGFLHARGLSRLEPVENGVRSRICLKNIRIKY
jgi:hypothetical protein